MKDLLAYIDKRISLTTNDIKLFDKYFVFEEVPAQTILLRAERVERSISFLQEGVVKGYQNIDGKIVVKHLVEAQDFFGAIDSFLTQTPSEDSFETITPCKLLKISKTDFDYLSKETDFWNPLVNKITNEHLACKLERMKDFQTLTAKERYVKFVEENPKLALQVSVDNIASFLGMEPQSLSRIRKQITI